MQSTGTTEKNKRTRLYANKVKPKKSTVVIPFSSSFSSSLSRSLLDSYLFSHQLHSLRSPPRNPQASSSAFFLSQFQAPLSLSPPVLSSLTSHHQLCCSPISSMASSISSMASLLFCCPSNPASLQPKKGSPPPYFKKKCK